MRALRLLGICLLGAAAGCPSRSEPDAAYSIDAAVILDAGVALPVEIVDAGPPQPTELPIVVTAMLADGGSELVDRELDPASALRVWIPVPLSDYRLRVFDETDRVVPSDDLAKDIDGGVDYQVTFQEPLKSGRNYRLTVESQLGSSLEGYKDAELLMKVRGVIEPETPKKPPKKKKR